MALGFKEDKDIQSSSPFQKYSFLFIELLDPQQEKFSTG